jgi:hypothetical protein
MLEDVEEEVIKETNDIILLIMNCKKYANKADHQKSTWLPLLPTYLKYFHVVGDETMTKEYEFDHDTNLLTLKVADDYNSLPKKVIAAFKAVTLAYNVKYIFKTDDDQMVSHIKFFDTISALITKRESNYGGFIVDIKQPYLSEYSRIHPELPSYLPIYKTKYCSGRFYFLSLKAVLHLLSKRENIEREYLEDYAIGLNLTHELKENILHIDTYKYFSDFTF